MSTDVQRLLEELAERAKAGPIDATELQRLVDAAGSTARVLRYDADRNRELTTLIARCVHGELVLDEQQTRIRELVSETVAQGSSAEAALKNELDTYRRANRQLTEKAKRYAAGLSQILRVLEKIQAEDRAELAGTVQPTAGP